MMTEALTRARQYRFRAEELRNISDAWIDRETRQILGRVAFDYERMAKYLEEQNRPERPHQEAQSDARAD
jgi:hypothetical protein